MNQRFTHGMQLWMAILAVVVAVCWGLSPAAAAQTVIYKTVNCDAPGTADFNSIHQAINSLDWTYPIELEVTGTCHERVFIGDGTFAYNSLYIHPPAGQRAAVISPVAGSGTVMTIGGAHGIAIERLDISGGKNGILIYDASEIDFMDVTIENNSAVGISVGGNSIVYFGSSRIRNNGTVGVDISAQGANTVYLRGGQDIPEPSVIEGNGHWGINAATAAVVWLDGYNVIQNNGGSSTSTSHGGIRAVRNSAVQLRSTAYGATDITGNTGPGIQAEVTSSVSLLGGNIHSNSAEGVLVKTHSVVELLGQTTFSANGIANVGCDAWSLMTGDYTGVDLKSVHCKNIDLGKN